MYDNSQQKVFNIQQRSFLFAVEIVKFIKVLPKENSVFAIGNQLIRSGTSVGANIEEAQNCGSRKEFIHTLTIALKEARETEYWLKIIFEVKLAEQDLVVDLLKEINEIIKILTSIIKKSKINS